MCLILRKRNWIFLQKAQQQSNLLQTHMHYGIASGKPLKIINFWWFERTSIQIIPHWGIQRVKYIKGWIILVLRSHSTYKISLVFWYWKPCFWCHMLPSDQLKSEFLLPSKRGDSKYSLEYTTAKDDNRLWFDAIFLSNLVELFCQPGLKIASLAKLKFLSFYLEPILTKSCIS